jgi:hypothetical protein
MITVLRLTRLACAASRSGLPAGAVVGARGNLWGMSLEEWPSAIFDWATSLGSGYWLATALFLVFVLIPWLARKLKRWRECRVERDYDKAAERRRTEGRPDPWTERSGYRRKGKRP